MDHSYPSSIMPLSLLPHSLEPLFNGTQDENCSKLNRNVFLCPTPEIHYPFNTHLLNINMDPALLQMLGTQL